MSRKNPFKKGDWLKNIDRRFHNFPVLVGEKRIGSMMMRKKDEFYKYAGMDFTGAVPRILGWPIYLDQNPPCDETKRPHYLNLSEFRKATKKEIAEVIAKRITG